MNHEISLEERIRNIEKLLLSILLFVSSYIFLIDPPKTFLNQLGVSGSLVLLILFLILFLISYLFLLIYLNKLAVAVGIDARKDFKLRIEKNKKLISYLTNLFAISSGILIARFVFEFDWKYIFGSIILAIVIVFITTFQKIANWVQNKLS